MTETVKRRAKNHYKNYVPDKERQEIVKELFAAAENFEKDLTAKEIAEIMARFDHYHGKNPIVIAAQDPHSTNVRARGDWKRNEGRRVVGGKDPRTRIKIVRPVKVWEEPDPDHPGQTITHAGGYDYWEVFDIRFTVLEDDVKQWYDDHPDNLWTEEELRERHVS